MKARNVDYVKESYLEGIQLTQKNYRRIIEAPTLVLETERRNTATDSTKLGTTSPSTERRIVQFRKQYDSTTSPRSSNHNTVRLCTSSPASIFMAIQSFLSDIQAKKSCGNQCSLTTRCTWSQPVSDVQQPDNGTTKHQSIQSRYKTAHTYDSNKKYTCQYPNHSQLFHIVNHVQEIQCD